MSKGSLRINLQWERPLDLLEVAYRLDGTEEEWMRELVQAATRVFRRERLGARGFIVRCKIDDLGRTVVADIGCPSGEGEALRRPLEPFLHEFSEMPAEVQKSLWFSSTLASTLSERSWARGDLSSWIEEVGLDFGHRGRPFGARLS
jgi:hypothetical protein